MPGIIFNFQFRKTLRDGSVNSFGLLPDKDSPAMCPVSRIDKMMKFAAKHKIKIGGNRLFTRIKNSQRIRILEKITTYYMTIRLHAHNQIARTPQESEYHYQSRGPHAFNSLMQKLRPSLQNARGRAS